MNNPRPYLPDPIMSAFETIAKEAAAATEKHLQYYRSLCSSDDEFIHRMSREQFIYDPTKTYYRFDGKIVFVVELSIKDTTILFRLIPYETI
jgi:hypothetical protein